MSSKTAILTDKAPKPLPGIYSQAIVNNGTIYCSGAVAMDPETGKIVDGDVKVHTVRFSLPPTTLGLYRLMIMYPAPMYQEPESRPRGGW